MFLWESLGFGGSFKLSTGPANKPFCQVWLRKFPTSAVSKSIWLPYCCRGTAKSCATAGAVSATFVLKGGNATLQDRAAERSASIICDCGKRPSHLECPCGPFPTLSFVQHLPRSSPGRTFCFVPVLVSCLGRPVLGRFGRPIGVLLVSLRPVIHGRIKHQNVLFNDVNFHSPPLVHAAPA